MQTRELKQNETFFSGKIWHLFFYSKNIKLFQWNVKSKSYIFMTKVSAYKEKKKSDNLSWNILKSGIIVHRSRKPIIFQWHLKLPSLNFMAKVSINKKNKSKTDNFPQDMFRSDISFPWCLCIVIVTWVFMQCISVQ